MKAYSLIGEQIACSQTNNMESYLDFNIIPAHVIIIVRKCNRHRHLILALTKARGLSRRYIPAAAFTRTSTSKLTCLLGIPPRSLGPVYLKILLWHCNVCICEGNRIVSTRQAPANCHTFLWPTFTTDVNNTLVSPASPVQNSIGRKFQVGVVYLLARVTTGLNSCHLNVKLVPRLKVKPLSDVHCTLPKYLEADVRICYYRLTRLVLDRFN